MQLDNALKPSRKISRLCIGSCISFVISFVPAIINAFAGRLLSNATNGPANTFLAALPGFWLVITPNSKNIFRL